jgi:hypothetical protein
MLRGEEARTGKRTDLSTLFLNNDFHHSILCCAFDLIRHCFNLSTPSLECLIFTLNVDLFNYVLSIELCIKYLGRLLTWNMIKRLKSVEERILEKEIWKKEYPVYTQLKTEQEKHASKFNLLSSPSMFAFLLMSIGKAFNYINRNKNELSQNTFVEHSSSITNLEVKYLKLKV